IQSREDKLNQLTRNIEREKERVDELVRKQKTELERIAGLSTEQAKEILLKQVENEVKHEMAIIIKEAETKAREEADRRARQIVSLAVQRCAADHVAESTVSV